jgi:TP901 family phage tail tape measure protein
VAAGEKILRVIIAGDALGAVGALESLSHGLERAHSEADTHGGGIMSSMGGAAKGIGLFAVGAAASLGAVAAEIYHLGSGYEQNLNAIQAFTHSTNDQMKSLESQLYSLSPKFAQMGQTVSDGSQALYELTKAGASSKDGMAELVPTMALAKATNTDYSESAKEMTRVLDSFGLKASDASTVADVLTNATHTSTQTLQDMADGLKYTSVAAHDFGIDLQTTAAVTAMYANAGIQGTQAGTAFRQMLLNLSAPTKQAKDAIKAIGLQAFDAQGHMKPLSDIFQQLQDKFGKGLDTHSLEKIAPDLKAIFGARGVEPIMAAIKQGGGGLDQYIKLMNRTGEASAIAQAKSKGLSGTFNMLSATMESAAQHFYMQVGPKLANFLDPFVEALPGYLSKAAKYGQEIWTALSDPGKAAKGPDGGSGFTKGLVEVGKVVHGEVLPALGEIGRFVKSDVIPVVVQFGKMFATQVVPFVARVASDIGRMLIPILRDVGRFVKTEIVPALKQWGEFVSTVVIPKMELIWTKVRPILQMLADYIQKKVVPLLYWAFEQMKPLMKDFEALISQVLDALASLYGFLAPVIKWLIDTFGGPLIDVVKGFLLGVFQMVKGVIEVALGLLDFLKGIFTGDWGKIWHGLAEIVSGVFNFIVGLLRAVIFGKIVKIFVEGGKLLMDAIEAPFEWIAARVESFGSDIAYGFTRLKQVAGAIWKTLWDDATSLLSNAMKSMSDNVVRIGADILKWFQDLPGELGRLLANAGQWLIDTGTKLLTGLKNGLLSGVKAVYSWFTSDLPTGVKGVLSDVGSWLEDSGLHMMEGFIKGIEDMAGKVKDSAVGVVKGAYNGVKSFLGINSPSRLYTEVGGHTGQGYVNGIAAKTQAVHDAVVGMVTVPANRFTAAFRQQQQTATTAAATAARNAGQLWASTGVGGPAQPAGGFTVPVTINVAGSIQAERDFARTMSQSIRDEIRQIARRNGGKTGLTGAF